MRIAYNSAGEATAQTQTQAGSSVAFGQSYTYDAAGRLTGIGYPGSVSVGYGYSGGRMTAVTVTIGSTTHNVATGITYTPFGPRAGWTYGNGATRALVRNTAGRLTEVNARNGSTNLQRLTYAYNAAAEISKITNAANTALTQTYGYDDLGRLASVTASGADQAWAYDLNGNRTSHTWGGATDAYVTASASNRLSSITGTRPRSFAYNARGNTTTGGTNTYGYDAFDRLNLVTKGSTTTNYRINALGQRVRKDQGTTATTTGYAYGPSGQVEAEYSWNGGTWTHYVRLPGGEPIALVRGGQVYSIHTDHLGRPEVATNGSKAIVWRASNYAFDRTVTLDSIGGLNLGFPGQYWDQESGLWYNHHRSYDPSTGRYVESDPIGLAGGLNTYAYVGGNPIRDVDPLGLESPGSFNNGGYQLTWERGANARAPDYIRIQTSFYVFNVSRTLSRSGSMFVAGGVARGYPTSSFKVQASISLGWLNQCEPPADSQVDDFLAGYGMAGAAGFDGVGGGVTWSPGSGTATEFGFGVGGGISPGEVGVRDGALGGGW